MIQHRASRAVVVNRLHLPQPNPPTPSLNPILAVVVTRGARPAADVIIMVDAGAGVSGDLDVRTHVVFGGTKILQLAYSKGDAASTTSSGGQQSPTGGCERRQVMAP